MVNWQHDPLTRDSGAARWLYRGGARWSTAHHCIRNFVLRGLTVSHSVFVRLVCLFLSLSLSFSVFLFFSVGMNVDMTLLHSCTFVSLVTELLCALDHSSNAFALAQVAPRSRLPFDMVAEL